MVLRVDGHEEAELILKKRNLIPFSTDTEKVEGAFFVVPPGEKVEPAWAYKFLSKSDLERIWGGPENLVQAFKKADA